METVVWMVGQKPLSSRQRYGRQAVDAIRHYRRIASRIYQAYRGQWA